MKLQTLVLHALPLALAAASAHAVDGVTLINQSKALAGGVTPGDEPGFPVTISRPGSYKLSGNLTVPDGETTAIVITHPRVTLDLNGFAIQGPVTLSGSGASLACTGRSAAWHAGVGVLVQLPPNTAGAVAVGNGTIAGMGGVGAASMDPSYTIRPVLVVRDLRLAGNGRGGLYGAAEVRDTVAEYNCGHGVLTSPAVRDSTARYNSGAGLHTATVLHVRAYGNGGGDLVSTSPMP
jgi:hypothetical protein